MYEGRIISAKEVTYNQKNENVISKGKVILKDEEQNLYFFDSLVVHKNLESGKGKNIKVIGQDRLRLAMNKCILKHEILSWKMLFIRLATYVLLSMN